MLENELNNTMVKDYETPKLFEPQIEIKNQSVDDNSIHRKNIFIINSTISALMGIKTKLFERKKLSSTITKQEFSEMVNSAKEIANNVSVSKRLDEIFEEYMPVKQELPSNDKTSNMINNQMPNMISEVESKTDAAIINEIESKASSEDEYKDGENKGVAYRKSDGHFKSNPNTDVLQ